MKRDSLSSQEAATMLQIRTIFLQPSDCDYPQPWLSQMYVNFKACVLCNPIIFLSHIAINVISLCLLSYCKYLCHQSVHQIVAVAAFGSFGYLSNKSSSKVFSNQVYKLCQKITLRHPYTCGCGCCFTVSSILSIISNFFTQNTYLPQRKYTPKFKRKDFKILSHSFSTSSCQLLQNLNYFEPYTKSYMVYCENSGLCKEALTPVKLGLKYNLGLLANLNL